MIRKFLFCIFFLFAIFFSGGQAEAKTVISDGAHLFTAEETEQIRQYCDTILENHQTSVYVMTSEKIGSRDDYKGYMDKIGQAEESPENLVLLFISKKKGGHVYQIYGYGKAKERMGYERCNKVMDHMQGDLKKGNYYDAMYTFYKEVSACLGQNPKLDSFVYQSVPQLIFCFLLSTLIIFLMARGQAGKGTVAAQRYIEANRSRLLGRIDHFSYMETGRVKHNKKLKGGDENGEDSHSSGEPHSF